MIAGRVQVRPDDFQGIATCGPVIHEVLQSLPASRLGDPLAAELFLDAADLYAAARWRGITIRSSVDCLIASIAIWHKSPVWHLDRDFDRLAAFTRLERWDTEGGRPG